jgi:hypothetical protein
VTINRKEGIRAGKRKEKNCPNQTICELWYKKELIKSVK